MLCYHFPCIKHKLAHNIAGIVHKTYSAPMAEDKSIAIIGAGLVGPLQALFLAQAGFEVHIYEKRSDFRGTSEFLHSITFVYRYVYYFSVNLTHLIK